MRVALVHHARVRLCALLQCRKPDGVLHHIPGSMVLSWREASADSTVTSLMLLYQIHQD